jgi:hypothetical protein
LQYRVLCSDKSRYNSGLCGVDTSRFSTCLCSVDTSSCNTGSCNKTGGCYARYQPFSSMKPKAANIFHQAKRLGANIFQRPRTFFIRRKGLAQTSFKVCPFFISKQVISRNAQSFIFSKPDRTFLQVCFNFQSKSMQERSKVLKVKAKQKSSMCSPRALEMPLYKECKKLIISSSSPYHHHFMLSIPPSLPAKFPHSPLFHGWA